MLLDSNSSHNSLPYSMQVFNAFRRTNEARLLVETPLMELSIETRIKLSEMLNGKKVLRHAGHDRDWRGLAELAKVRNFCNQNSDDPMQTVLIQWCQRNAQEATCYHLLHFLSQIDRWDVSDDIFVYLVKDAHSFVSRKLHADSTDNASDGNNALIENEMSIDAANSQEGSADAESEDNQNNGDEDDNMDDDGNGSDGDSDSSLSPPPSPPPGTPPHVDTLIERVELLANANAITQATRPTPPTPTESNEPLAVVMRAEDCEKPSLASDEINPLTRQDAARLRRGLPLTKYDAFVLYADPDQQYANEMQQKLEKYAEYNFELVFKNRDLLGGTFFHDAVTELMEERCNYVLLIVTQNFSRDFESCFFFNNAQTLQLKENRRKIIPLLYDLHLPRALRGLHTLKYQSEHFWDLLVDSLSVKVPPLLVKVAESKIHPPALSSLPKPPDTPIAVDEKELKKKSPTTKKSLLKKPDWIKKKKIQK